MKGYRACPALRLLLSWIAAVAFIVSLGADQGAFAADQKPQAADEEVVVQHADGLVTLRARNAPLRRIVGELGTRLGFSVVVSVPLDQPVTISLPARTVEEMLGTLLGRMSYAILYRDRGRAASRRISEVRIYGGKPPQFGATESGLPGVRKAPLPLPKSRKEIRALANRGTPSALAQLAEIYIRDANVAFRVEALRALSRYRKPLAFEIFQKALSDPSPWVRRQALQSLSRMDDARSREIIRSAVKTEKDESLRRMAEKILEKLEKAERNGPR